MHTWQSDFKVNFYIPRIYQMNVNWNVSQKRRKNIWEKRFIQISTKYAIYGRKESYFLAYVRPALKIHIYWIVVYLTSWPEYCEALCSKVITSKAKSSFAEYFRGILTPIKIYLTSKRMPQKGEIGCFQQIQSRFPSMIRTVFENRSIAHQRALAVAFKTTIGMERINFLKISWPNWSASSHSIAEEIFQSGGICLQTSLACTIGLWSALTLLNLGTWIC